MADRRRRRRRELTRQDYERGLPDHHDPAAGIGGAAPAYSALTLRIVLASFGLVFCSLFAWWLIAADAPVWLWLLMVLLAVVAVVDLVVVIRRKLRGEPG